MTDMAAFSKGIFQFGTNSGSSLMDIEATAAAPANVFRFGGGLQTTLPPHQGQKSRGFARNQRTQRSNARRMEARSRSDVTSKFHAFQDAFLQRFEADIHESLRTTLGKHSLVPAALSVDLQRQFVELVQSGAFSSVKVSPAFHGTPSSNFDSIFQRGLLVPGKGNELTVVNGAAHGQGVYTANVNASWLSAGFCSEPKMLVCAVLQTSGVNHVADAQVVADASHVLPLFVATGSTLNKQKKEAGQQKGLPAAFSALGLMQHKSAAELRKAGCSVAELKQSGYAPAALRLAGYSSSELKAHYSAVDLCDVYVDEPTELLQCGYTLAELREAGLPKAAFPVANLLDLGYTLADLHKAGCEIAALKRLGIKAAELLNAGFTFLELRWGSAECLNYTAAELKAAGATAPDLRWVCTPFELKEAGYTASDLKKAGFGASCVADCYKAHEIPIDDDEPIDDEEDDDDL